MALSQKIISKKSESVKFRYTLSPDLDSILISELCRLIQQFAVDTGMAKFNEVKIVPITEFKDVVVGAKKIHGL